MASSGAIPSASSANRTPRILACVLCQQRKIKCDRTFPCSNCTKTGVKCTPSTPAPARKRRRPNQDLQERLARCEELLKEYASDKPGDDQSSRTSQSQTPVHSSPFQEWQSSGKLVHEDGGVRFMDSMLLGIVHDELRAMKDIVDDYNNDDESTPDTTSTDENSDLLLGGGGETPRSSVEDLQPDAGHIFGLWQIYLDRVNPLTKIIHVPTLQPYLIEATIGSQNIPRNIETLLFSIYLMAVVALSHDECQNLLGYSRDKALQRFSTAVRLSLSRQGFLKCNDLTTLQALVIYLISLQGRYNRHAAWILNGVVIRMAQKMGLHRDGEPLGLSPFESEMRRRLWWQILMVDAKYAMLSGLSHSLLPRSFDTKPPSNLNDADILPSATEPFQSREGPTEMIFCLLTCKIAQFFLRSPGFDTFMLIHESGGLKYPKEETGPEYELVERQRLFIEELAKDLLDTLDRYCDPSAGPVHEMAIDVKAHILEKMMLIVQPATRRGSDWDPRDSSPQDNAFRVAVASTEHNTEHYVNTTNRGFLWHALLHFQLDIFFYMAVQLTVRTEGELVERAWKQLDLTYEFHPELYDMSNKTYSALAQFVLKAWGRREPILQNRTGFFPDKPDYVAKLRKALAKEGHKAGASPLPEIPTPSSQAPSHEAAGKQPSVNEFLDGYIDVSLDWDMFMLPGNSSQTMPAFGNFAMAPTSEWSS